MGTKRIVASNTNSNPKLQRTRNYSQFSFAKENRPINVLQLRPQHKALRASMQKYGFLPAFPMMVSSSNGKFIVKDGQHRLTFAREFGLEVFFVVDDTDISISDVNQAQAGWTPRDFAMSWAGLGRADYREAIAFADTWNVPIGSAFCMLGGTIVFRNILNDFHAGTFKIKNRVVAERVAKTFKCLTELKSGIRNNNLLTALWACCHTEYFDEDRLIQTVTRRPDMIYNAGTRENFLSLLEDIYNFNRKAREALKFDAEQVMRERNPKHQNRFGQR